MLDARPELDPGQAVHAQVAVQHAVQADAQAARRLWAQLGHGAPDDAKQFFRVLIEARSAAGFRRRMRHRMPSPGTSLDLLPVWAHADAYGPCREIPAYGRKFWRGGKGFPWGNVPG
ncbi:hypothetical protein D3C76_1123190 [compost metagenome]